MATTYDREYHVEHQIISGHPHGSVHYDGGPGEANATGVVNFDYDAIDELEPIAPEDATMTWADASSAISLILGWCVGRDRAPLQMIGARVCCLLALLDPINCSEGRRTITDIARESGFTKQSLSKALGEFRRSVGIHLTIGKSATASESYRAAARRSIAAGTHSSDTRRDKIAAAAARLGRAVPAE
jgi:hypothetical protein